MRTLNLLMALLLMGSSAAYSQDQLTVDESLRPMSKGTQPAFTLNIPQTNLKDVEKEWMKYIKSGSKEKSVAVGGEIIMPGAVNKNIAAEPFTIYSTLLETNQGVFLSAWFGLGGDSVFITRELNNGKDLAAKKYIRDFAIQRYRVAVKAQVEIEKGKMKDLEKELKGLEKDEDKANKNINGYERDIQRSKDQIATNDGDEKRKGDLVYAQKTKMDNMNTYEKETLKAAEKVLKTLEKEKEKIQKDSEKENRKIDDWNSNIREERRKIDNLKQDQRIKRGQIADQKKVISEVEQKLKDIK
ncbi:MAG: hypothetical protein IPP77_09165 [Bacteroidetes bacterium]|nr:hypothetical protein [Bacteroidota bacterium]